MALVYGIFNENGEEKGILFYSWEEYNNATFPPEVIENSSFLEFQIHGKTYAERKASCEDIAIEWSNTGSTANLSWLDCMALGEWFETNGERYGLLKDFRENGFC